MRQGAAGYTGWQARGEHCWIAEGHGTLSDPLRGPDGAFKPHIHFRVYVCDVCTRELDNVPICSMYPQVLH